jgi:H+/Cl- antiporter ClcA
MGNPQNSPGLDCLIGALVLGILGGIIGGVFIRINNWVNLIRKKLLKNKLTKILEGLLLTALTITIMFSIVGLSYENAGSQYNA